VEKQNILQYKYYGIDINRW